MLIFLRYDHSLIMTQKLALMKHSSGFTLLELSVVLTIIALIAGGIMTGQNLVRQSELRSLTNDMQRYHAAFVAFRDQYDALPGDFSSATSFWGPAAGGCAVPMTALSSGTTTCDGNGDGFIGSLASPGTRHEWFRAWQHLANAKLIEGSYTGTSASAASADTVVGVNVPETGISGVGFTVMYFVQTTDNGSWFGDPNYGNFFSIGASSTTVETRTPFLSPKEAFLIDQKFDDGLASSGTLLSRNSTDCAVRPSGSDPAAYVTINDGATCMLRFKLDL
jgi:prepilin-type N-terminal cleavage/methylation domain-containing protein